MDNAIRLVDGILNKLSLYLENKKINNYKYISPNNITYIFNIERLYNNYYTIILDDNTIYNNNNINSINSTHLINIMDDLISNKIIDNIFVDIHKILEKINNIDPLIDIYTNISKIVN